MARPRVLVACEFSGMVRDAFLEVGVDAWSCDLMPPFKGPNQHRHIRGDVLKELIKEWDLVIAHPPCTYLALSGCCRLYQDLTRWSKMRDGAEFFIKCLNANSPRVCVENPVMHGHAKKIIKVDYSQIIQPWQFGDPFNKKTLLWLKGLPKLTPTNPTNIKKEFVLKKGPSFLRGYLRSITFKGIAKAMADQWGGLLRG